MSTQGALTSSPPSSSAPQWTYDIFLSFNGDDTRNNFTSHLYNALGQKGIWTFKDDKELKKGEPISEELLRAIEKSRFAIVIFSENYASSQWCLDELVHIIKCMKETKLKVMPVFYHVNPSDVQKQEGTFAQAFKEHKKRIWRSFLERLKKCKSKKMANFLERLKKCKSKEMTKWRSALREVPYNSGWDLRDRDEAEFIQEIVRDMEKLISKISSITKNSLGIESKVQKLISLYFGFENNVGMIGIYGMGGVGKTTLARVVYEKFHHHFESSSFIANVREDSQKHGLPRLQQQLLVDILEDRNIVINNVYDGVHKISERLCNKKVLLVIDDVNQLDQLENLAGEHSWFGKGSCIIITTRDERVLDQHGVLGRYKLNGLNGDDASKLFYLKAKKEQPKEDYRKHFQEVVDYANGLPLAIVILGSFFIGRTIEEWQHVLDSFKKTRGEIFDVLKISYDGLDAQFLKEIFLDIACLFGREKKDQVIQILENCGFNAKFGITTLMEKSLLTIDGEHLGMHDLIREMGEKIVQLDSNGHLGKQSRLWLIEDLLSVLENNMATEAIQAIGVTLGEEDFNFEEFHEGFSKMSNLRLLIIKQNSPKKMMKPDLLNAHDPDPNDQRNPALFNSQRHLALPNNLRYISWRYCPFKCLASSLKRMAFVQLDLQYNKFEYLWKGVMHSSNLKFIDLRHSYNLIETPNFSGVPILEGLNLSGCVRLVKIHRSIGQLSKLRHLNLKECESLTKLPSMSAKMQSLTNLTLSQCIRLSLIPKFIGIMKSLSDLYLDECENLEYLPNMDNLRSLKKLILYKCSKLKWLPRLPSTVSHINAESCCSLKWLPMRAKLSSWSQPLSQWHLYDESKRQVEFTILLHFLQGILCRKIICGTEFQIIISLFSTEIEEKSIRIDLPLNWYSNKWIGFALWASVSGMIWKEYDIRVHVIALDDMPQNHCASEFLTTTILCGLNICLFYLSRDDWFDKVGNDECTQIKVIFETNDSKFCVERCGVNLVYKQDVNKFNQRNSPYLIESFGKEVSIYKLTVGDDDGGNDEDDDGSVWHPILDDGDGDDVYTVGDDDENYYDAYTVIDDDDDDEDDDIESWR